MKKFVLVFLGIFAITVSSKAQITITQADIGVAGDSITVAYDSPSTAMSVGGTGSQTWNFSFAVNNINTLKFQVVANTNSGAYFPGANLAIERQDDTIFFNSTSNAFILDGLSGDWLGLGYDLRANFNPNAVQVEFPSTYLDSFLDTAVFDTVIGCAALGISLCDSAHVRRESYFDGDMDAHGTLNTPSGTYATIRQYLKETNHDRVWVKLPFIGWSATPYLDSNYVAHNYRWFANGEQWPVLSVIADGAGGDIIDAEFKIDENVLGYAPSKQHALCNGSCNGSATVQGLGGLPPYTYTWPASAGSQTSPAATGLCAGTYVVTITDANASTGEVSVTIEEPIALSMSGSVQHATEAGGNGKIDITVGGGKTPYTYAWTSDNGFTSTDQDPMNLDSGLYYVTVKDSNNCILKDTFEVGVNVGVNEIAERSVSIYPNPVGDIMQISANEVVEFVTVYDLLGNRVLQQSFNKQSGEINVSELSSGPYMLEAKTAKGVLMKKMTIQR